MNMRSRWTFLLAAVGIVAVGCATPQSQELKQAQQSFSAAQDNASMSEQARVTLYEAKQALDQAQNADNLDEQKHYAYLARKKIDLARIQADQERTRQEVQALQDQQEKFLLTLRQSQAETARRQAERAQEELQTYRAQERQQELARAQRETQQAQQEAERARQEAQMRQQEAQQAKAELEQMRQQGMEAKQTSQGMVLTLSNVVFETDKAQLKPGAEREMGRLADFLKRHSDRQVLIEGFTDSVGAEQYNQELSERRARAVAQALEANGIPRERVTTRGLGESYPIATNNTEAGRQRNRRVEITILNPESRPEDAGRGEGRM